MNLLFGHDAAVAEWVAKQAHNKPFTPPFTAFGLVDITGRLTGGYVFTGYNGDTVEVSAAGNASIKREAWAAVLHYVFEQLGCSRLQMHTNRRNKRMLRIMHKLKMPYEGVAKRYFGRNDGIVFALTHDSLAAFKAKWRI